MIVVGSRCGGHDFIVELPSLEPLWIGAKENSDLDVLLGSDEPRPYLGNLYIDVWMGGIPGKVGIYTAPYSIDGELFIPKDLAYLQRVAKRRIRHKYGIGYVKSLWDKELNFLNKDGSFFARLKITRHIYK